MNVVLGTLAIAMFVSASGAAQAAPGLRFAVLIEETQDGQAVARSLAESFLLEAMSAAGHTLVDPEQSKKIRALASPSALLGGEVPEALTSRDADVIIAGVVHLDRAPKSALLKDVVTVSGTVEAKIILVDTGEIPIAFNPSTAAHEPSLPNARRTAAKKLAKEMLVSVQAMRPVKRIELNVALRAPLSVSEVEPIAASIRALPGVENLSVLDQNAEHLKVELRGGAAISARALAVAIDGLRGTGLFVFGYSANAVHARYEPAKSTRVPVTIGRFRGGALEKTLPKILVTELEKSGWVEVREKNTDTSLVLSGEYRELPRPAGVYVHAALSEAYSKKVVLSDQATCPKDQVTECAAALGAALAGRLGQALQLRAPPGALIKPLVLDRLELEALFPSQLARYAGDDLLKARWINHGRAAIARGVARAWIEGEKARTIEVPFGAIAPGQAVEIPVRLALDLDAALRSTAARTVLLTLELEYQVGELSMVQTQTRPVLLHPASVIDWTRAAPSAAAFVTSASRTVASLADRVRDAAPSSSPLAIPVAALHVLDGFRYQKDPEHPYAGRGLDFVLFPAETWEKKSGDCDDLAVLYAAITEASGRPAMLLLTPGHVLVAVETALPAGQAQRVSLDPSRTLLHDGRVWIPVETTRLGAGFEAAWADGAARLRAAKKVERIVLRDAWKTYPQLDRREDREALALPELSYAAIREELGALELAQKRALEAKVRALAKDPSRFKELGTLHAMLGAWAEARAVLEAGLKNKYSAAAGNNLGNINFREGDISAALEEYERALAAEEKNSKICANALLAAAAAKKQDRVAELAGRCDPAAIDALYRVLARTTAVRSAGGAEESILGAAAESIYAELTKRGRAPDPAAIDASRGAESAPMTKTSAAAELSRFAWWL